MHEANAMRATHFQLPRFFAEVVEVREWCRDPLCAAAFHANQRVPPSRLAAIGTKQYGILFSFRRNHEGGMLWVMSEYRLYVILRLVQQIHVIPRKRFRIEELGPTPPARLRAHLAY